MDVQLRVFGDAPALIDGDNNVAVGYERLNEMIETRMDNLGLDSGGAAGNDSQNLVFLNFLSTIDAVVDYLALRRSGATALLLDPQTSAAGLGQLVERYQPTLVLRPPVPPSGFGPVSGCSDAYRPYRPAPVPATPQELSGDVALLLSASPNSDNPKRIQLTEANLAHNASAVGQAIGLESGDRGLAHLPLFHSLGLSVLNSHLAAGATTVLTGLSPLQAGFWGLTKRHSVTSIPTLPTTFPMFARVGMLEMKLPDLRSIHQMGGPIPESAMAGFCRSLVDSGRKLYYLYGQTEATAFMSVASCRELEDNPQSVGYPLAGGSFRVELPGADGVGQIMYSGPNVTLGYAGSRADVGRRTLSGELPTGDFGRIDDQGRVSVVRRFDIDRLDVRQPSADSRQVAGVARG